MYGFLCLVIRRFPIRLPSPRKSTASMFTMTIQLATDVMYSYQLLLPLLLKYNDAVIVVPRMNIGSTAVTACG